MAGFGDLYCLDLQQVACVICVDTSVLLFPPCMMQHIHHSITKQWSAGQCRKSTLWYISSMLLDGMDVGAQASLLRCGSLLRFSYS